MQVYATIWSRVSGLTWDQARFMAERSGGQLIKDEGVGAASRFDGWTTELDPNSVLLGYELDYVPVWIGAQKVDGVWQWLDGTEVAAEKFGSEAAAQVMGAVSSTTADGSASALCLDGTLTAPATAAPTSEGGFIADYSQRSVTGTNGGDVVLDLAAGVSSLNLLGGDDAVFATNAPKVLNAGAGNDSVNLLNGRGESSIVYDGHGSDVISVQKGEIRAALDGDDDILIAPKVTYEGASAPILAEGNYVTSEEIGTDELGWGTKELYLGSGNDRVSYAAVEKVYTRAGDDFISIGSENGGNRWVDAGAGDDWILAGHAGGTLIGGAGNDTLVLSGWDGYHKVEMTGGSGADLFKFTPMPEHSAGMSPIIHDFSANGAVQDSLDLSAFDLGETVAEALGSGRLNISQANGYTYLAIAEAEYYNALTVTLKGNLLLDIQDNLVL
jgi:hypothetical protein